MSKSPTKPPTLRLVKPKDEDPSNPLVLLVDDHRSFRRALMRQLCPRHGSTCIRWLEASDGVEALDILNQQTEPVALVVTDLRMPWMDGDALLKVVAERWPETARLMISGWTDGDRVMDSPYEVRPKDWHPVRLMDLICRRAHRQP